jgi:hypothetical protein
MSTFEVRTTAGLSDQQRLLEGLTPLLAGVSSEPGDVITSVTAPSLRETSDETMWTALLSDPAKFDQRRGLLAQLDWLLELDAAAKAEGCTIESVARERAEACRRTLERGWVSLLEQNRVREEAIRGLHLEFLNMDKAGELFRDRIVVYDAMAREVASEAGRAVLANELSHYVDRPDPRRSRAYLNVHGWAGNATDVKRLGRVAHDHRAIFVGDGPPVDRMDKARAAAMPGGLFESLTGDAIHHRHMILVSVRGRARRRFVGRYAEEARDLYVPLGGPWFGMYLERIAAGEPWRPPVGYQNPIRGIDRVELDLRLKDGEGFKHFHRHRLNPAMPLSAGSESVVVWGCDTTSTADGGVQMGIAIVEMMVVRYSEWIVNQYGLNEELEKAEGMVRRKLSEFVVANSGAGRMFRSGSRVEVTGDLKTRSLVVNFNLLFREVAERAEIRLVKPQNINPAELTAKSGRL